MNRKSQVARERAEICFALYCDMGPKRSLRKLRQRLLVIDFPIALSTLKTYSHSYGWQRRLAELNTEAARRLDEASVRSLVDMHERHAQLGRTIQGVGATRLRALLADPLSLPPASAARFTDTGVDIERQAVAQAADREEISTGIWNTITGEMLPAFLELNELPDADDRARRFVEVMDHIVEQQLVADGGEEHPA